jgi:protein-tyrosine phosphatase
VFESPAAAERLHRWRRIVWAVIAVALATFLAINHDQVRNVRDRFIAKRWGVVVAGKIYRSGQLSSHLVKETLAKHRIQRIVDLTFDNRNDENHTAEVAAAADLGIEYRLYPLDSDGTGDVHIYAQAVAAVDKAEREGQIVLVHCYAGSQRTGGVVALYRLLVQNWSPEQVLLEMRRYKYDPHESPILLNFLNEHIEEIATELVELGSIAAVPHPLPRLKAN